VALRVVLWRTEISHQDCDVSKLKRAQANHVHINYIRYKPEIDVEKLREVDVEENRKQVNRQLVAVKIGRQPSQLIILTCHKC